MISDIYRAITDIDYRSHLSSKELAYVRLLSDAWRNNIINAVPEILKVININSDENFNTFISWCFHKNQHLDWRIGLSLRRYISGTSDKFDSIEDMLVLFSCSQWAYSDKSNDESIVIFSNHNIKKLFVTEKKLTAKTEREVYILQFENDITLPYECCYSSFIGEKSLEKILIQDFIKV